MIILIDLDGTLTNTAHPSFKKMKDGLVDTDLSKIKVFDGAIDFIKRQKEKGNVPIIVSDSHPKYVNKIAREIFNTDAMFLADKPNTERFVEYFEKKHLENPQKYLYYKEKEQFLVIGDSWLDIEFGRKLNYPTILTSFYEATEVEKRDGIGQDWKPIKSGPTFYAKTYNEIEEIIENPLNHLLALEASFIGSNAVSSVKFRTKKYTTKFIALRALARQGNGECDKYTRADKYFQIGNPQRTNDFIKTLASGLTNYIAHINSFNVNWDILTYVTDKQTTVPKDKMKSIFDLIKSKIKKETVFSWQTEISGSIRDCPDYKRRRSFVDKNLYVRDDIDIKGKNIIIIDDQFTTGATAFEIINKLYKKGVGSVLFIALFYLITAVYSKKCPKCGKDMIIKVRRNDGNRFYSCLLPKYGGNGCGFIENID